MAVKINMETIWLETLAGFDLFYMRRMQKYTQFLYKTNYKQEQQVVNIDRLCVDEELTKRTITTKWIPKMKKLGWIISPQGRTGNYFFSYGQDRIEEVVEDIEIATEQQKKILPNIQEANSYMVYHVAKKMGIEPCVEILEELFENVSKCISAGNLTRSIIELTTDNVIAKSIFVMLINSETENKRITNPEGLWILKFKKLGFTVNK